MKKSFIVNSILLFVIFLTADTKINAQEIRLYGNVQVYGYIEGGFTGGSIGIESPISNKLTFNIDASFGSQKRGSTTSIKPAILYYFSDGYMGFFIGPSLKYVSLKEKSNGNDYDDNIYGIGFTLGVKTALSSRIKLIFALNPHLGVGGQDVSDVAGISGQIGIGYRI